MKNAKPENIILIAFTSFLFVGIVLSIISFFVYNSNKSFYSDDVDRIMATITDIETYGVGDDKKYNVSITYTVNGVDYSNELGIYSSSMRVGKEVEITYKLSDPSNMHYAMGDLMSVMVLGGLGCIFAVVGLLGSIILLKKKRDTKMLFEQGVQIIGTISEVIQDSTITINGRHPYRIIAIALNPKTNEILEAYSEIYKSNPAPYIELGSEITIYADLDKNKGMIKDISFKEKSRINQDWVSLGD